MKGNRKIKRSGEKRKKQKILRDELQQREKKKSKNRGDTDYGEKRSK